MLSIDARGLFCPAPMVMAREAIRSLPAEGGQVQILVDNQMAAENLGRMAAAAAYGHSLERLEDGVYSLTITVGEARGDTAPDPLAASPPLPQDGRGLVVAIGRTAMGGGSEELGEILIKGFLYSLSQLPVPPQALLLFNGGIKLALAESNALADIQALDAGGTRVLVCGTCVNYYEAAQQLRVGEIGNMFDLVREMAAAQRLIQL